jgi:hypothetical protein
MNTLDKLKAYQGKLIESLKIDYVSLDDASIDTPRLYGEFLAYLTDEMVILADLESQMKKVYKARWSYYMGHATEDEYKKEPLRVKINKLEINKYLDADVILGEMNERVTKQAAIVKFLEEGVKAVRNRQFSIRDAIDWRKFQSGG